MPRLAHIALLVPDYDEALAFYVGRLRFRLVEDIALPDQNKRWVVIAPPNAPADGTSVLLARAASPDQAHRIGDQAGGRVFLFLHTNDFARDYAAFTEAGVHWVRAPAIHPYGIVAVFRDPYGNLWDLVEPGGRE